MARLDCPHEVDVLTMVSTGQWPERAPADLRAHVVTCAVCADLASVARAIDDERAAPIAPRLPSSGTVWWRAQLRARQDAAREVGRPITVAQAVLLAVAGGVAGAVFGASADWFQRALHRGWRLVTDAASAVHLPSLPSLPADMTTATANYSTILILVGLGAAVAMAVVVWAFREE